MKSSERLERKIITEAQIKTAKSDLRGCCCCMYTTYRDRSVFAVEYSRRLYDRLKLPPFSIRSRYCLNHALFYPDNLISCVCRSIRKVQRPRME